MVRFVLRCLPLVLFSILLVACGSNNVALQGRVLDAYTNEPIEGALLRVGNRSGITTDADGSYTTTDWNAEETLTAEAAGYEATTINLAEEPGLQASEAQASPGASLDLILRPDTLNGTVTSAFTGEPLADALVQVSETISATTSADGTYTLEGLPESFQVTVTAPDHAPQRADLNRETEFDTQLRPDVLRGVATNTYTGAPVEGITVRAGEAVTTTDADGRYELRGIPENAQISFEGDGYDVVTLAQPNTTSYDVVLRPNMIAGSVVDAETGAPLAEVELVAMRAPGEIAHTRTRSDAEGNYRLPDVPEGSTIMALLPGYLRAETTVQQGALTSELRLEPFESKSLYMSAALAAQGGMDTINQYFDIIDRTELNSMILDIKSDSAGDVGKVYYATQVPQVLEIGNWGDLMPLTEILAEAKRRGIYMIARVQVFAHDNSLLEAHPDWYVQKNGQPWFAYDRMAWLDAFDERVWDYNIALSVEAAQLGFDEVQFDYVRFPSDGNLQGTEFKGPYNPAQPEPMYDAIGRLCERAHRAINDAGAFFSADVFGYAAWHPMSSIGQNLSVMGKHLDYVYPMVYPSHFVYNELGLGNPDEHPFEIVDHSMKLVRDQLQGEASRAKVRPWLQDFTATWIPGTITYGPAQVRAQIDAAENNRENGTRGWALWNAGNRYTVSALKPSE